MFLLSDADDDDALVDFVHRSLISILDIKVTYNRVRNDNHPIDKTWQYFQSDFIGLTMIFVVISFPSSFSLALDSHYLYIFTFFILF